MNNYYKVEEFAAKFGVCIPTVLNWCKKGKIKAIKIGGKWFINDPIEKGGEESKKPLLKKSITKKGKK